MNFEALQRQEVLVIVEEQDEVAILELADASKHLPPVRQKKISRGPPVSLHIHRTVWASIHLQAEMQGLGVSHRVAEYLEEREPPTRSRRQLDAEIKVNAF